MDIFSIKSFPHKFTFTVSFRNFQSLKNFPMFPKEFSLKCFPNNSLSTVSLRIIIVIEFTVHHFPKEFPITISPRIPHHYLSKNSPFAHSSWIHPHWMKTCMTQDEGLKNYFKGFFFYLLTNSGKKTQLTINNYSK